MAWRIWAPVVPRRRQVFLLVRIEAYASRRNVKRRRGTVAADARAIGAKRDERRAEGVVGVMGHGAVYDR
eukprot:11219769-Lingulodinium_polyedra.AAC.1